MYVSTLVWDKLDDMSQNNNGEIEGEDLPQIGPLLVDMQLQRRYILAGILKVSPFGNTS